MLKKTLNILFALGLFVFPLLTSASVFTQEAAEKYVGDQTSKFREAAGYDNSATVGNIAATIINIALGLLGIGFVVLLIYGGYMWMMARGNEEDAKKAMSIIQMAVIGLVIIVTAYSITFFVFSSLDKATFESGGMN